MKIKRYPGKAVDASLSLEDTNAMGVIYEANWMHAHRNMGSRNDPLDPDPVRKSATMSTLPRNSRTGYLNGGVSVLSEYQTTLDQIRDLEQRRKDDKIVKTIKDLNGYKPSTLRRKPRKQYPGWDELVEGSELKRDSADLSSANSAVQQPNHYVVDPTEKRRQRPRQRVPAEQTSLKRSHTMGYPPKSAATACSTLDIKDLRRIWRSEQDTAAKATTPLLAAEAVRPVIATQPQLRQKQMPPPPPIRNCNTRASCSASRESCLLDPPTPAQRTVLPPNRTTSARGVRGAAAACDGDDHLPPKPPPRKNLPVKQLSPRSVGATEDDRCEAPPPPVVPLPRMLKPASLSTSTENINAYTSTPASNAAPPLRGRSQDALTEDLSSLSLGDKDRSGRQPGSSSSINSASHSSDDQFIIPRPRLIVPVHTYARKRRTGNLKDQDLEQINTSSDNVTSLDDGKSDGSSEKRRFQFRYRDSRSASCSKFN